VCPKNPVNFNVDNIRVAKLVGGGLRNSTVVRGMVLRNDAVGSIKRMENAKVSFLYIWDCWGGRLLSTILFIGWDSLQLCHFSCMLDDYKLHDKP
jgi:hypothetical protein